MNLDDLEKQWEEGDDEDELKTEGEILREQLERRRKQAENTKLDPRWCTIFFLSFSVFLSLVDCVASVAVSFFLKRSS